MRWNCPHCGANLAAADEKVGVQWSFSRCYKCGGFALVRRSDAHLIKVDRAPAGEPVLLPEAHEDPTAMLSGPAAIRLAQSRAGIAAARALQDNSKPVIRTAVRRNVAPYPAKPAVQATSPAQRPAYAALANQSLPSTLVQSRVSTHSSFGLPEPLPEQPAQGFGQKLVPFAVAAVGMLAIASGVYLYVQGQALWEKARSPVAAEAFSPQPPGNEIIQAPGANLVRNEVVDEVHSPAMAPTRGSARSASPTTVDRTSKDKSSSP
jgi:hypothetical protein